MVIFNSYVKLPEGNTGAIHPDMFFSVCKELKSRDVVFKYCCAKSEVAQTAHATKSDCLTMSADEFARIDNYKEVTVCRDGVVWT